ncbi:acylneuraminate cytidylyltransferase family protein [Aliarcobacter cryaerophilus]|uniref:acylneuraminate cytidylyltransferase family protein n=1 Tax=Aliarcobacter cryaerophilus TaxID=28198 RepID=UPI0021B55049|nr:acylneuraminate cytidylyltransferase family protein [Aliarcobacter cryaerophilus]MCT7487121.1 acylneuraminate cytidylyltransferase family protein [Aliarcobacter cryaerophilus]MCT7491565.1 acylneuraminate cytidylyltransferase family protein [Aliarcobacter cryaerophilus]
MYKDKSFIAIIPARSGSKGLPNKNIKELNGKPLIGWSIETAFKSKYLDEIFLSTDSQYYSDIASEFGLNTPFLRPLNLSTDNSTNDEVIEHTLNEYKDRFSKKFDYIVWLEPTSPLREDDDIDNMIEKIVDNQNIFDSIVSIGEVDEHPNYIKRALDNGELAPYCMDLKNTVRRQDNDKAFFPYGVAYISKVDVYLEEKTFYSKRNTYFKIKKYQCYEIDDIYNFLCVEAVMKFIKGK